MAKQHGDYPCAPPERVAQLLSLGVGYEGYIEFQGGHKIFVEVTPNDHLIINQQQTPQDTILSVYVTNPANPLLTETEKHWGVQSLQGMQIANSAVGLSAGAIEHFSPEGTMRLTKGGKISPHYYGSGWKGGSPAKIKTYKVTTVASKVGKVSFILGLGIDIGMYRTGEQSGGKTITNIAFSVIGTFGGPAGLIIYGLYFGWDLVGAFDGPSYVALPPKDPRERYIQPADATRVERVRSIESVPRKNPIYTPREQPILKQGYKK